MDEGQVDINQLDKSCASKNVLILDESVDKSFVTNK